MEKNIVLVLTVNNHPGVMSHITGLFSRRNFNLEGILCAPIKDGTQSRMYLLVNDGDQLKMIMAQLSKLYDVKSVEACSRCDTEIFYKLDEFVRSEK
jgi:acetolactate synthase I/III small subunit